MNSQFLVSGFVKAKIKTVHSIIAAHNGGDLSYVNDIVDISKA